jgi:glucose-6-phosphate isomerase
MIMKWDGPLPEPAVRTLGDMRGVLADPRGAEDFPLYFMYRNCALNDADRTRLNTHGIRFDITVIPPAMVNGEYVKTKGHFHPPSPDGTEFPELYQVLAGTAYYLLQDIALKNFVVVPARSGDAVLIPPGMGHVTINPGSEILMMANFVSNEFESQYEQYEAMHGAAYYHVCDKGWMKNPAYPPLPPLRFKGPKEFPELGICHGEQIYDLIAEADSLRWLNQPAGFRDLLCWL